MQRPPFLIGLRQCCGYRVLKFKRETVDGARGKAMKSAHYEFSFPVGKGFGAADDITPRIREPRGIFGPVPPESERVGPASFSVLHQKGRRPNRRHDIPCVGRAVRAGTKKKHAEHQGQGETMCEPEWACLAVERLERRQDGGSKSVGKRRSDRAGIEPALGGFGGGTSGHHRWVPCRVRVCRGAVPAAFSWRVPSMLRLNSRPAARAMPRR